MVVLRFGDKASRTSLGAAQSLTSSAPVLRQNRRHSDSCNKSGLICARRSYSIRATKEAPAGSTWLQKVRVFIRCPVVVCFPRQWLANFLKRLIVHFVAEHRKTGSIQLAELSVQEKHVLGLIRQSEYYAPELLLDIWRAYLTRKQAQANPSLTIAELCKAFYDRQIKEGRAYRKGLRLHAEDPLPEPFPRRTRGGYRAWIRTMNNASKGRR